MQKKPPGIRHGGSKPHPLPCGSGFYPRKPHRGPSDTPRRILRGQSPLPQGSMAALLGAGSTRESRTAVHQIHRAKPFAGRARSHKDRWQPLWERVLPAKVTLRFCRYNAPNSSRAEPAPTRIDGSPLWERVLPAKVTLRFCRYNVANSSRAEPAPTGISATQGGSCSSEGAAAWVISGTALPRWSR